MTTLPDDERRYEPTPEDMEFLRRLDEDEARPVPDWPEEPTVEEIAADWRVIDREAAERYDLWAQARYEGVDKIMIHPALTKWLYESGGHERPE